MVLVKLWDLDSGKIVAEMTGHAAYVDSVAFSANGKLLVSTSADGMVKVWDARLLTYNGCSPLTN